MIEKLNSIKICPFDRLPKLTPLLEGVIHLKAGDKVLLRTWEDMEQEYGLHESGDIWNSLNTFGEHLRHLAGSIVTIKAVDYSPGSSCSFTMVEEELGYKVRRRFTIPDFRFTIEEEELEFEEYIYGWSVKRVLASHYRIIDDWATGFNKRHSNQEYDQLKEIIDLKKELKQAKKENQFLKETIAYFAMREENRHA